MTCLSAKEETQNRKCSKRKCLSCALFLPSSHLYVTMHISAKCETKDQKSQARDVTRTTYSHIHSFVHSRFLEGILRTPPLRLFTVYTHPPHAKLYSSYSGDLSSLKQTVFFCEALKQGMVYDSMKRVSFVY